MRHNPSLPAILRINLLFILGFALLVIAWLLQPDSNEEWRFGLLAILYGLGGIGIILKGFGNLWSFITRDRDIYKYKSRGRDPSSDGLVDDDDHLKNSGVVDDV